MKVYLAGPYSRKDIIHQHAIDLLTADVGITLTSTWLREVYHPDTQITELTDTQLERIAMTDVRDIDRCDVFVVFTQLQPPRGGHIWETGYAYAKDKLIILVGPRENVFHSLFGVIQYDTWEKAFAYLHSLGLASQTTQQLTDHENQHHLDFDTEGNEHGCYSNL